MSRSRGPQPDESFEVPDPLTERPPDDRFCDVVLNGGVASGVVYPWALLTLARHYRFHSVGGNSVGAMAAAMAAAAEYGRCHGVEQPFEPLRQMPEQLAELQDGKTRMLRLFQPGPGLQRLFDLLMLLVKASNDREVGLWRIVLPALRLYGAPKVLLVALLVASSLAVLPSLRSIDLASRSGAPSALVTAPSQSESGRRIDPALAWLAALAGSLIPAALGALLLTAGVVGARLAKDLSRLQQNGYGLCTGRSARPGEAALLEWLHEGIQRSAGRSREDPPLTFADLWAAPRAGRRGPAPTACGQQPPNPGIALQMFTSNLTLARPVRLPLNEPDSRFFYRPREWAALFPGSVMAALNRVSQPYAPASGSEPDPQRPPLDDEQRALMSELRELPSGGMPLVVAARMSLCFPLLFSLVPVYAIDHEAPLGQRRLRRCLFADGGLCTNFPVHLFDAAHPRWPTFALMLDDRLSKMDDQAVWLPKNHLDGRADNWQRFMPGIDPDSDGRQPPLLHLLKLAWGMGLTMKGWNDRTTQRLPHVRNRVVRLALEPGEGQLNLGMPRETMLSMAHRYGTLAANELVARFVPGERGEIKPAWREHLYIRAQVELRALREHLRHYAEAIHSRAHTLPLRELLAQAVLERPLAPRENRPPDLSGQALSSAQYEALSRAVAAVEALEAELADCEAAFGPYQPAPKPELQVRAPI